MTETAPTTPNTAKCPFADCAWKLPAGTGLQMLGLGLMVGGMTALGPITTPRVFGFLGRQEGGPLMTEIFRGYDNILLAALALVLVGEGLRWLSRRLDSAGKLSWVRLGLLGILTASMLYSTLVVNADIERLTAQGIHRDATPQGQQFEATHRISENLYKMNLLLAAALILLTPFATMKSLRTPE